MICVQKGKHRVEFSATNRSTAIAVEGNISWTCRRRTEHFVTIIKTAAFSQHVYKYVQTASPQALPWTTGQPRLCMVRSRWRISTNQRTDTLGTGPCANGWQRFPSDPLLLDILTTRATVLKTEGSLWHSRGHGRRGGGSCGADASIATVGWGPFTRSDSGSAHGSQAKTCAASVAETCAHASLVVKRWTVGAFHHPLVGTVLPPLGERTPFEEHKDDTRQEGGAQHSANDNAGNRYAAAAAVIAGGLRGFGGAGGLDWRR